MQKFVIDAPRYALSFLSEEHENSLSWVRKIEGNPLGVFPHLGAQPLGNTTVAQK